MKKIFRALAIALAATALASSACAQQGAGGGASAVRSACFDDAKKFCSDVEPGGGRIIGCLEDHSKELSDACYDVLQKFEDMRKKRQGGGDDSDDSKSSR